MSAAIASFLAGALSTLSPCVLPLIPVLLAGALQSHRMGPLALAGGLAVSFTVLGVLLASFGLALGIDQTVIRTTAAVLMTAFGVVLLAPPLQRGFAMAVAPLAGGGNAMLSKVSGDGLSGQFGLGLLLGAVWSPCTGPTLGAAVGLAAQRQSLPEVTAIMAIFALGAAAPILLLAYGSRGALAHRKEAMSRIAARAKPVLGAVLLAVGPLVLSGLDKTIEAAAVAVMPDWLVALTVRF